MNVVWHDHEGMQQIVPEEVCVVVDGFYDHICEGWLAQVEGSATGFVQ
jgi:hypothetical protein